MSVMRALLAVILLHEGQGASSLSSRRRSSWVEGSCLAVFHTQSNFLGPSYIAGLAGNGECQSHDSIVKHSPGAMTVASGHFWTRSRCRFQVYRSGNCRHGRWLNLDARVLKVSWTQIVSEVGGPAGLLSASKGRFGSARCTCSGGAAVLHRRQAGNGSIAEEDDDDDEDEDEDEEEETPVRLLKGANEAAEEEVGDVEDDVDEAQNEVSLLEAELNETSEEESQRSRRRRAFEIKEHRACSYLFYRAKNSWTHPYSLGKVRRNKCMTFRPGYPGVDFWRGYAFAEDRCQLNFYLGKKCSSHSWAFTPGLQGSARLSWGFRGWAGNIRSVGCRCW